MAKHILEIKYRALYKDNYQGGSGKPFEDRVMIELSGKITLDEMDEMTKDVLSSLHLMNFISDVMPISSTVLTCQNT